jgi:hypothetical protein
VLGAATAGPRQTGGTASGSMRMHVDVETETGLPKQPLRPALIAQAFPRWLRRFGLGASDVKSACALSERERSQSGRSTAVTACQRLPKSHTPSKAGLICLAGITTRSAVPRGALAGTVG